MDPELTVFVVDDDSAVRKALQRLVQSVRLNVEAYSCAEDFLDAYDPARPGCLVLDVRMPGMSGLELQEKLAAQQIGIPVIFITGHGEVPLAVRAMKTGAVDFLEKPFSNQMLLDRIRQAIKLDAQTRREQEQRGQISARLALLTPREREVLDLVVAGKANKQIAAALGISEKTVQVHRFHLMKKLKAKSLTQLVQLALAAEIDKKLSKNRRS